MKFDNDYRQNGSLIPEANEIHKEAEKFTEELFEKYGEKISLEGIAHLIGMAANTAALKKILLG